MANGFEVHLHSVENWRRRWDEFGLLGLFEGRHTGQPPKLSDEEQRQLSDLARDAGGTARTLQRQWQRAAHTPLSRNSMKGYLKRMAFRYKRCRHSLKGKRDAAAFDRASLLWTVKEQHTARDDVIAFFDGIAEQFRPVPCSVVLDNANIHHGEAMEQRRRQWQRRGLSLYYRPPYSPELNRIEILWKQTKDFWRKFTRLSAAALVDGVHSIMANYGAEFTINFR